MLFIYQKYKPHYRQTLSLATPIIISQLGHTFVHLADSIIVGHFAGTTELAAVSLVNSIFILVMVLGMGISNGLTPIVARENGAGNYELCGKYLVNSLLLNAIVSIVLFCLIYFGTLTIIDHIGQSPAVVRVAKPYLMLLGISIIPLMVFQTFKQFTEGLGFTFQAMMVSIWGNLINILLGITFVNGLFGIEPMGVSGVGYSTLIDRCIMAIAMMVYVMRSRHFKPYLSGFRRTFIDKARCLRILKIGTPVALQYTFELSAFSGAAILAGTISASAQAAHQVTITLASITPEGSGQHGAQLSIIAKTHGREIFDALVAENVLGDWRSPNVIRLSPVPLYNSYADVFRAGQVLLAVSKKLLG